MISKIDLGCPYFDAIVHVLYAELGGTPDYSLRATTGLPQIVIQPTATWVGVFVKAFANFWHVYIISQFKHDTGSL